MHRVFQDVKFACRSLVQSPGFAVVAIVTLALGIGANSAIFSVVNGVVLQPLPYRQPERLLFVYSAFPSMGFEQFWMSQPEYLEYRDWNRSLVDVGAYNTGELSVTGGDTPVRVSAATVTRSFFTTLGVEPMRGRIFSAQEDAPGGDPAVVLSAALWQRAFGGRADAVGSSIEIDGERRMVVGVMPPGFDIHDRGVEVWQPMGIDPANPRPRSNHFLYGVARLRPQVSAEAAAAELGTLLRGWRERVPDGHVPSLDGHPLQLVPMQTEVVGDVRAALLLLLAAVGFVLLIACANVGNLLLARAESRHKEIAVRAALGAGRARLLQQFLTESVLLSVLGGAAGLVLGRWGLQALLSTSPDSIPRIAEIGLDARVLGFTLLISLLTGVLFGMAPMLHLTTRSLADSIREGGERSTDGSAKQRLRRVLVVGEIALAVVLVIGAGLMLRSFSSLRAVDPGFDPEGLLTFRLFLPAADYPEATSQMDFFDRLVQQLGAIPGVVSATAMNGLPPLRRIDANDTEFEGVERTEDGPPHNVDYYQWVTDGYFDTMGIEVLRGRGFEPEDVGPNAQPVTVVNETLARTFYPGQRALDRRIRPCCGDDNPWLTIVGVVRDVKQGGLDTDTGTEMYFYTPQVAAVAGFAPRSMNVVVHTSVPASAVAAPARRAVHDLDPSLPIADLQTMGDVLFGSVARPRFLTLLLTVFGVVALALAAVGTYGVMSYSVAERRHEMGIRMALGAERTGVLRLVLGQGLRVAVVGLLFGVAAALLLTRFMAAMLFGIGTTDPVTFVAVPAILVLVALVACLLPAHRATRVDPMVALRS